MTAVPSTVSLQSEQEGSHWQTPSSLAALPVGQRMKHYYSKLKLWGCAQPMQSVGSGPLHVAHEESQDRHFPISESTNRRHEVGNMQEAASESLTSYEGQLMQ